MKSKLIQEFVTIEEIKDSRKHAMSMGPFGSNITRDNFVENGIPVIRGVNLKNNQFSEKGFVFLTEEKADQLVASNAYPEDIVFTHRGTLGQVVIIPKNSKFKRYVVSQSQMKLSCDNSKVNPGFVYYYFCSPQGQHEIYSYTNTTGVPSIGSPLSSLKIMKMPYLKLEEQNKIVKTLDDLDTKIQNLQNQNHILEQTTQTIFKSWFVDFDGVTEFEDSELGKIPTGWKAVLFKEFGECVKGFSYRGIEKFSTPQGFEFVTLNSIKEGGGFKKRVTWLESDRLKERHFVKELDLIIANTEQTKDARLLSTPALVQFSHDYTKELAVYSHHITRIDSKILNSKFYLYSLFLYQQKIIANAYHTGTGVWGFDHTGFSENHFIIKPNQEILNSFEKFSFEIHSKIIKNEKSISILTKTRDILLPKLMSGEIRV